MTVRVQAHGGGEVAMLGRSFNSMAETLHRTQQELLHKEKLASMGQLAAGVAHEINNPLGSILLFSEAMYKDTLEGDPRCDDLRMIINETTRCKNIVADLLNFARQQEVLAQETDVHVLLEQVIEEVCHQSRFEGVELVRQFSPDLPAIQADPAQLQQVFINLLNNGAEAMGEGGTITLTTRPVNGHWVEIRVSDTGCGIPAENLGKLFTPFFTTKPPGKGTGLGLSIVYGIVKMHHGQITVQSQLGEGTTFTVMLPIRLPVKVLGVNRATSAEVIG
jgi:two-component system NtrC family sensor kinase